MKFVSLLFYSPLFFSALFHLFSYADIDILHGVRISVIAQFIKFNE